MGQKKKVNKAPAKGTKTEDEKATEAFLKDYRKLSDKHGYDFRSELVFNPKAIISRVIVIKIERGVGGLIK